MIPALELHDVAKSFGPVRALSGVSLTVQAGEVHCVLGENGAGKSTLCNLVNGGVSLERGTMTLYGEPYRPSRPTDALAAGVAMVHQHFSLVPTLTIAENLLLARGTRLRPRRRELHEGLARIEETYGLSVPLDELAGHVPVGVRQQAEIIKCLLRDPRLLLLDEPTAVLGPADVDALLATCRRIAEAGKAVVLVTHKLGEVTRAGDNATVLRGGTVAGAGPLAGFDAEDLVELMVGRPMSDLDPLLVASVDANTTSREAVRITAEPVFRAHGLTLRRTDGTLALDGVDLEIAPGEIVGVAGVEGNGQSELVTVLSGAVPPDSGSFLLGEHNLTFATPRRRTAAGLGVIPEDRHHEGCVPAMSIAENLFLPRLPEFARRGLLDRPALHEAAARVIEEHGIRAPGPSARMSTLSGGNQQKVVVARELALDPLVCLVAAQPTRGLDIGAVDAVLGRIRSAAEAGAAVLVISSELSELLALCHRIVVAYRGRLLGPVPAAAPQARDEIGRLMVGAAA
ncbi:ABC transporter ATP-binding protein [Nonomuraea sp. NPDC050663]|uniref:ABC transporter ATP-binding protein n=1 Tax=Nonomuraea sp. NPDC050663 TaxID=3364370 RepID=UPI003797978C